MNITNQDENESNFIDGTIEKKGYRKRWKTAVDKIFGHPYKLGIHMDTHHLISAESVTQSEMGDILVLRGYDINHLTNLVGFPATLPGACQLHCQLHRGDHIATQGDSEPYHDYVKSLLMNNDLRNDISQCMGKTTKRQKDVEIQKLLEKTSNTILKMINSHTETYYRLPLTKIANFFLSGGVGCVNRFDVIPAFENINNACEKDRKHFKDEESDRNGIDYRYQRSPEDKELKDNEKTITCNIISWKPQVGK